MKIVVLRGAGGGQGITALGTPDGLWVLLNVTAPVAHRLGRGAPDLGHPGLRDADVRALVLTDAQLDHVGGLLALRDGVPIDLYATPAVFEELTTALPVLPVLQHYCGVHWRVVPVAGDQNVATFTVEGMPTLEFSALATRTPPLPHAAERRAPVVGDSIAIAVHDRATGQRVFCAPGLAQIGATEFAWMREADCLLVDGEAAGTEVERPSWVELLPQMPARHKVIFGDGPALGGRGKLAEMGIELAYDGMEIEL
jgi:pyrroloquinoline quinone biosynthesis protein B